MAVRENQACSIGALAATAKNGNPIEAAEQSDQPERGMVRGRPSPAGRDRERQRGERDREHAKMHDDGAARIETAGDHMRIAVTEQQHTLEEHHRHRPDEGDPPSSGSTILANIGCTENRSSADRKIVPAKTAIRIEIDDRDESAAGTRGWVVDMRAPVFAGACVATAI